MCIFCILTSPVASPDLLSFIFPVSPFSIWFMSFILLHYIHEAILNHFENIHYRKEKRKEGGRRAGCHSAISTMISLLCSLKSHSKFPFPNLQFCFSQHLAGIKEGKDRLWHYGLSNAWPLYLHWSSTPFNFTITAYHNLDFNSWNVSISETVNSDTSLALVNFLYTSG